MSSNSSLNGAIANGDMNQVLIQAADLGLTTEQLNKALAETLVVMAEKSEADALVVGTSVKGVESRAGTNLHEVNRAGALRELASRLLLASRT